MRSSSSSSSARVTVSLPVRGACSSRRGAAAGRLRRHARPGAATRGRFFLCSSSTALTLPAAVSAATFAAAALPARSATSRRESSSAFAALRSPRPLALSASSVGLRSRFFLDSPCACSLPRPARALPRRGAPLLPRARDRHRLAACRRASSSALMRILQRADALRPLLGGQARGRTTRAARRLRRLRGARRRRLALAAGVAGRFGRLWRRPAPTTRFLRTSTVTVLERPCEKLWRTCPVSTGLRSSSLPPVRPGSAAASALGPLLSLISLQYRILSRRRRPSRCSSSRRFGKPASRSAQPQPSHSEPAPARVHHVLAAEGRAQFCRASRQADTRQCRRRARRALRARPAAPSGCRDQQRRLARRAPRLAPSQNPPPPGRRGAPARSYRCSAAPATLRPDRQARRQRPTGAVAPRARKAACATASLHYIPRAASTTNPVRAACRRRRARSGPSGPTTKRNSSRLRPHLAGDDAAARSVPRPPRSPLSHRPEPRRGSSGVTRSPPPAAARCRASSANQWARAAMMIALASSRRAWRLSAPADLDQLVAGEIGEIVERLDALLAERHQHRRGQPVDRRELVGRRRAPDARSS